MNKIERVVDDLDPRLSVMLRALKMRWRNDVSRRLLHSMVKCDDVVVDVGANRGVYTYLMSALVGPGGRVHAVEPFPGNDRRLEAVARWRGNVVVHSLAVSDRAGEEVLRIPVHDGHLIDALATLEPNRPWPGQSHVVRVSTLDDLLADERRVSFLKCDVEGHEQRVFAGAAGLIERGQPVVLAEVEQRHREDAIDRTFEFFAVRGYQGWFVAPDGLYPLAEFDLDRDQLSLATDPFTPYMMPVGYVCDFVFCPSGTSPPPAMLGSRGRPGGRGESG
jgi:FkbM family methyltransferase